MGKRLRYELLRQGSVVVASENVSNFFVDNRRHLAEKLRGGIVVLPAYTAMQRGNDIAAVFEQEANFWWTTGVEEPDWWLIIDGTRAKSWLVAPHKSSASVGDEATYEQVRTISGADQILSQDAGVQMLRTLAKKHSVVRTLSEPTRNDHLTFAANPAPKRMNDMLDRIFNTVQDCRRELSQLRAIKQPEEITRIKKVVSLTVAAHEEIKPRLLSMKHEYEVEAEFMYYFRRHGALGYAYDPIIAAGSNAGNLSYHANNKKLKKREMILIDVGARLEGYVSGVARTYAYGEPTRRQQEVHEVLQQAHEQIIKLIAPHLAVDEYQRAVDSIMQDGLLKLGLLSSRDDLSLYRQYFPHAISHGVGIDQHDSLGAPHFFQPGMVVTVEPGVYIPKERLGVRFGDTILITSEGTTNLSARLSTDL